MLTLIVKNITPLLTDKDLKVKYLDNLHTTMIRVNDKSFKYGDGKAWDNKKTKTRKQYCPRGKAFMRIERMELARGGHAMLQNLNDIIKELST